MTNTKKTTTKMVAHRDLKVGDTMWFSGYWITLTRFVAATVFDGWEKANVDVIKVYGRFPYTPADQDVLMFSISKHTKGEVTVKL